VSGLLHIVVVDDSPGYRRFVRSAVQSWGIGKVVGEARDGFEGLRLIERVRPDVAVIDVNMPGLGGAELIQFLRMRSAAVVTRLIAYSTDPSGCAAALAVGADAAVVKASDPRDLLRALEVTAEKPSLPSVGGSRSA
jgi:DNA-binding NarL/FixJ family response regulator